MRPPPRSAERIVGRDGLLARLGEALAPGALGTVLLVGGDPGVGKTRIARAAAASARVTGRAVIEGGAAPTEPVLPFGVFQDALRTERRREAAPPAIDNPLGRQFRRLLLPELGGPSGAVDRGTLFEAASAYVRARARGAGLLLILEDLHWADPTSIELVHYLGRTAVDAGVVIMATYRLDDASPELTTMRRRLLGERLAEEHILEGLRPEEVGELVDVLLGRKSDEAFTRAVVRLSEGNPFVVEELVGHALLHGHLDVSTGAWRGELPDTLPWGVREMLLERARRLPEADSEILRWAAVIGREVDPWLLSRVSDASEDELLAALARLETQGLLWEQANIDPASDGLCFRHELAREAILEGMLHADRRRRHRRILEMADEAAGDDWRGAHLDFLAAHAIAAGDRRLAFGHLAHAARRSVELSGYLEADTQYARALEHWEPLCGEDERAALLLEHGRLLSRLRRDPRAPALLDEARSAYLALGDRVEAAAALAAGAAARWNLGARRGVLDDLRRALDELGPSDRIDERMGVLTSLSRALFMAGDLRAAATCAREGLELVREDASPAVLRQAIHLRTTLGSTQWLAGDADAGGATLVDALQRARGQGDALGAVRAHSDLAYWHLNLSAAEAATHAEAGLAMAQRLGVDLAVAWLSAARALVHLKAGDATAATALLDSAESALSRVGPDPELRLTLGWARSEWILARGEGDAAAARLAGLRVDADSLGDLQLVTRIRRSHARALLAAGVPGEAASTLAPLLDRWEGLANDGVRTPIRLAVTAAETAVACGDATLASRVVRALDGRETPRAEYAAGLVRIALGGRPAPGSLARAAALVAADGWAYESARMLLTAAVALGRVRDARDEAIGLADAARQAFGALDLPAWGRRAGAALRRAGSTAQAGGGSHARGLSGRELEVLRLVASGASNREVAERLVISEKTAARHMANIFGKLGARRRADAVRIAIERGLLGHEGPPA